MLSGRHGWRRRQGRIHLRSVGQDRGLPDARPSSAKLGQARPEDISATVFDLLGIDPETEIRDKLNRPMPVSRGKVIEDVIG
jgi:hypothetical protein